MDNLVNCSSYFDKGDSLMTPKEAAEAWKKVCESYDATRALNLEPRVTMASIISDIGRKSAYQIFAIVTKIKKHDGRIYGENRNAMERINVDPACLVWDYTNPLVRTSLLDHIHPSHINQLITELRKR